jgi:hypothetical protein
MASRLYCTTRIRKQILLFIAAFAVCWFAGVADTRAENFRIETKVFEGKQKEPTSETTTIFCDGVVYDFLKEPAQTAVFSRPSGKNAGRFILLNDEERIRTEFSTAKLEKAMTDLQKWASEQSDKHLKFASNPEFEESIEPGSGQLVLASHFESYTVSTVPTKSQTASREYREFLDWYTQLNTLLTGTRRPPLPRLELNKSFSRHKVIPVSVELTSNGFKKTLRAEHDFKWILSQGDMERIEEVKAALASYRDVGSEEFSNRSRSTYGDD